MVIVCWFFFDWQKKPNLSYKKSLALDTATATATVVLMMLCEQMGV
jgi:hypothetical protein